MFRLMLTTLGMLVSTMCSGQAAEAYLTAMAGTNTGSNAGTIHYVSGSGSDSNDGLSAASAFRTLQRAADRTLPGDSVYVMNGNYTDRCYGCDILRITRSGTASAWITYKAYPGHTPRIRMTTSWVGIRVAGASYIVIEGFEVEGNAANITPEYAYAQRDNGGNPETNGNCITVRDQDARFAHNIIIRRNHIHHCPGAGISTRGVDYFTVEDNIVHSNAWWSVWAESGISFMHPRDVDSNTGYKNFIRRNISYNNRNYIPWVARGWVTDGNGIIVDDTLNTAIQRPYRGRTRVENNLVYLNGGAGIQAYKSENVDIINNTAYMNAASPELQGEIFSTRSSNVRILNNILFARKDSKVTHRPGADTNIIYDYNIYFNSNDIAVRGPNDIIADPMFVDAANFDFRLRPGSPAIDSGTSESAPATDLVGVARPDGARHDRGAYEALSGTGNAAPGTGGPSAGTIYYVSGNGSDSNDGSSAARAFRTLQRAADLTLPGDAVYVMNGTYTDVCHGCDVLRITRSGTASAWITYKAHPGHTPRIKTATSWVGIRVAGASYIAIEGFEVEGNAANITWDYAYAQRNNGGNPETNGNCITVRDQDARFPHNILIRRNHVHHCPGAGIATRGVDYLTVEDNIVHSNGWWGVWAESGISLSHPRDADGSTGYKNFIRRNFSYNNRNYIPAISVGRVTDGNGVVITRTVPSTGDPYRGRTLVENNVVYVNGGSGIHAHQSENVDIINNTAYMNGASPELQGEIFATRSRNVRILNNILNARRDAKVNLSSGADSNVMYDYNLYFNSNDIAVRGPNDIIANPMFVDEANFDFRLRPGSPAIDSGTSASAPATDIEGLPRPNGAGHDRGAYEAR